MSLNDFKSSDLALGRKRPSNTPSENDRRQCQARRETERLKEARQLARELGCELEEIMPCI